MCTRKGHLEAIDQIRQMIAEQKFYEAQKLIEVQLKLTTSPQYTLLKLYLESLSPQNKFLSPAHQIELAERSFENNDWKLATELLEKKFGDRYFSRATKLKLKLLEVSGRIDELYKCLSEYLLRQFEFQMPCFPEWVNSYSAKYFKNDFSINLKYLSLYLMINDLKKSEDILKNLIVSSFELSRPRGKNEKIQSLSEVLINATNKGRLEIYQNFCQISTRGIREKSDYKKLIEMIIYFEEFNFQIILIDLLLKLKLEEIAEDYAKTIRSNKDYSFVYIDKFFPHLKKHFLQSVKLTEKPVQESERPYLEITEKIFQEILPPMNELELDVDEFRYNNLLKYQNFNSSQLCDLAVSFIQSEMPRVALSASDLAISSSESETDFLKASYLKLTCQMLLNDFRAAIDTSMDALRRAKSKEDILSFLYGQAEAYIRLNLKSDAKRILKNIVAIDGNYRLAKERLEKLNEV